MTKKNEAKPARIVKSTEQRMLKVTLTKDELLKYGQEMADAQQQIVELENELASFKDENKGKVTVQEGTVTRCSTLVRQKYEHRRIPCSVTKDYTTFTIRVTRDDTGEVVEDRPMNENERTMLPMVIEGAPK